MSNVDARACGNWKTKAELPAAGRHDNGRVVLGGLEMKADSVTSSGHVGAVAFHQGFVSAQVRSAESRWVCR